MLVRESGEAGITQFAPGEFVRIEGMVPVGSGQEGIHCQGGGGQVSEADGLKADRLGECQAGQQEEESDGGESGHDG